MDFLKTIGGKIIGSIVGGIVALLVVISAVSWFTMSPAERQELLSDTGAVLKAIGIFIGWVLLVGVVPWATFFLIAKVARIPNNLAGAALVVAYTALEAVLLAWMYGWSLHGVMAWVFFIAAVLVAGVYNLFACDWIAEKVS